MPKRELPETRALHQKFKAKGEALRSTDHFGEAAYENLLREVLPRFVNPNEALVKMASEIRAASLALIQEQNYRLPSFIDHSRLSTTRETIVRALERKRNLYRSSLLSFQVNRSKAEKALIEGDIAEVTDKRERAEIAKAELEIFAEERQVLLEVLKALTEFMNE